MGESWGSGKHALEMQVHPAPQEPVKNTKPIKEDPDYLVVDVSKFPIEDFDDATFESKSPAEWIQVRREVEKRRRAHGFGESLV